MLKYLIIFLLCILYIDVFSQVVIKEEVILYTEGIGDTTETLPSMPFYGRYYVRKDCYTQDWRASIKMEVYALGQTKYMGCYNYNCGGGGW